MARTIPAGMLAIQDAGTVAANAVPTGPDPAAWAPRLGSRVLGVIDVSRRTVVDRESRS